MTWDMFADILYFLGHTQRPERVLDQGYLEQCLFLHRQRSGVAHTLLYRSLLLHPRSRIDQGMLGVCKNVLLELSPGSSDLDHPEDGTFFIDNDDSPTCNLIPPKSFLASHQSQELAVSTSYSKEGLADDQEKGFHFSAWKRLAPRLRRGQATETSDNGQNETFEGELAVTKGGWWHRQMLVDRSLRSMAALMTFLALVMVFLCANNFPAFLRNTNPSSTSVGGSEGESCETVERKNIVRHCLE